MGLADSLLELSLAGLEEGPRMRSYQKERVRRSLTKVWSKSESLSTSLCIHFLIQKYLLNSSYMIGTVLRILRSVRQVCPCFMELG